jgi:uncharacterized protein YecE (DUF72 family)
MPHNPPSPTDSIRIGTAGWAVPGPYRESNSSASHLEQYARFFNAVEINSSFRKPHRASSYMRWSDSVPDNFRFSVKLPKRVSHDQALKECTGDLLAFLKISALLGDKLGALLVQLPPSLVLDEGAARAFFAVLCGEVSASIVCEPRHPSWFTPDADQLFRDFKVSRVQADPPSRHCAPDSPSDFAIRYFRLHGSPVIYYSSYSEQFLTTLAGQIAREAARETWCMFDNTAGAAAWPNALSLQRRIAR